MLFYSHLCLLNGTVRASILFVYLPIQPAPFIFCFTGEEAKEGFLNAFGY